MSGEGSALRHIGTLQRKARGLEEVHNSGVGNQALADLVSEEKYELER